MRNGRAPENSYGKGKSHSFDNGMVKVGGTYKPNGKNFITLNVSYGTRAPYANNVYISPRIKDTAIDYTNERDLAADLTYTFIVSSTARFPVIGLTSTMPLSALRSTTTVSLLS